MVTQTVSADAIATGIQDSTIDQSDTTTDGTGDTPADSAGGEQSAPLAVAEAADAAAAASEPVDGTVVDSAGDIIGTLDSSTGNVVDSAGNIVGTLNETTGLVLDSAGDIIGSVTNLIDGASVATPRAKSSVS